VRVDRENVLPHKGVVGGDPQRGGERGGNVKKLHMWGGGKILECHEKVVRIPSDQNNTKRVGRNRSGRRSSDSG